MNQPWNDPGFRERQIREMKISFGWGIPPENIQAVRDEIKFVVNQHLTWADDGGVVQGG